MVAIAADDSPVEMVVGMVVEKEKIHEPDEDVLLWFFGIFSVLGIAIVMA
ncbi:MAG: hypothetical protein KC777_02320 [Cyanobacteria bacterium HKST-UBA02]|nr:hypothetical protein [Cyanobacteria bacterium HKST-UBA02]